MRSARSRGVGSRWLFWGLLLGGCDSAPSRETLYLELRPGYQLVLEFPDSLGTLGVEGEAGRGVRVSVSGTRLILTPLAAPGAGEVVEGEFRIQAGRERLRARYRVAADARLVSQVYVRENESTDVQVTAPVIVPVSADTTWIRFPAEILRLDMGDPELLRATAQGSRVGIHSLGSLPEDGVLVTVVLADSASRLIPLAVRTAPREPRRFRWSENPVALTPDPPPSR